MSTKVQFSKAFDCVRLLNIKEPDQKEEAREQSTKRAFQLDEKSREGKKFCTDRETRKMDHCLFFFLF